jgi:hypothetical protein
MNFKQDMGGLHYPGAQVSNNVKEGLIDFQIN